MDNGRVGCSTCPAVAIVTDRDVPYCVPCYRDHTTVPDLRDPRTRLVARAS